MAAPKLSKLELRVMDALWELGPASIRELQEKIASRNRPAYTTVQTIVNRLEEKQAVRRVRKVGNAHIFEATVSKQAAHRRVIKDLIALFGGRVQPLMLHLVESGQLTLDDIETARKALRELSNSK
jgi:predicted transcriptional regulator